MTYMPLKQVDAYQEAYNNWKKQLENILKIK